MRILVLNSGSSSLKFSLFEVADSEAPANGPDPERLLDGRITNIGGRATLEWRPSPSPPRTASRSISDHIGAVHWLCEELERDEASSWIRSIEAVGHRIVHGGIKFSHPIRLNASIMAELDALSDLAPLHNPGCLAGIRGVQTVFGAHLPMVGVFDTAFHQSLPSYAHTYALPFSLTNRYPLKRYGFHGIAHASLLEGYRRAIGREAEGERVITVHLGNGCSITAISQGQSIDTSMGFTPLEGLMMGTRSGDLDPSIVSYLSRQEQVSAQEVDRWLNERSGLLGVSGRSHDMRVLLHALQEEQDERAELAVNMFCYRVKKYIGSYLAVLGGADALIFGGGIGEASPEIRARICTGMEWCGLQLDPTRNAEARGLHPGQVTSVSLAQATLPAYVVAVDEALLIVRETYRCLINT